MPQTSKEQIVFIVDDDGDVRAGFEGPSGFGGYPVRGVPFNPGVP